MTTDTGEGVGVPLMSSGIRSPRYAALRDHALSPSRSLLPARQIRL
jgi:hypothetical protein